MKDMKGERYKASEKKIMEKIRMQTRVILKSKKESEVRQID